jgi:lipopolysaccharide assembly protein A
LLLFLQKKKILPSLSWQVPMRSYIWRLILLSPLLLLIVLFTLSNTESARIALWPTDLMVEAPLSLLMLLAMGVAFLAGALTTWIVGFRARLRARRAEQANAALRAEVDSLRTRLARAEAPPNTTTILPPATASRALART